VKGIRDVYSKKPGAFASYLVQTIDQFKANPADWKPMQTPVIPDGAPIGMDCYE
jgi:hypothetical protein